MVVREAWDGGKRTRRSEARPTNVQNEHVAGRAETRGRHTVGTKVAEKNVEKACVRSAELEFGAEARQPQVAPCEHLLPKEKKRSRLGSSRLVLHLPSTMHVNFCIVETRPSSCCGEPWTSDVGNAAALAEVWPLRGKWRTMEREWDGEHRWIAVLERSARYSY